MTSAVTYGVVEFEKVFVVNGEKRWMDWYAIEKKVNGVSVWWRDVGCDYGWALEELEDFKDSI